MSLQFDVFHHPSPAMRKAYPFILVLQHDSVASTSSIVIAPLVPASSVRTSRTYPTLDLLDKDFVMLTPELETAPRGLLTRPIANIADQRALIIAAIDMLFAGS